MARWFLLASWTLLLSGGCNSESSLAAAADPISTVDAGSEPAPEACVPDADEFTDSVRPILEARCAQCHGKTPDFGAPFSLLDYDALRGGKTGKPLFERVAQALVNGAMPPAGQPRLTHEQYDRLVAWARCGAEVPPYPSSLKASKETFDAPAKAPAGTQRLELTAQGHTVAENTIDRYEHFVFANVVKVEQFVKRIDVILDQTRVVHHITLHHLRADAEDPRDASYLYAWAPGTGAVELPNGGLRIYPSDKFRIEIHYNNVGDMPAVTDSSGVALYVGEPAGTEYAMLSPTTFDISVPAKGRATSRVECTAKNDFLILAGMPHMHEIGDSFSHVVERVGGGSEEIISLTGWSFEQQPFYLMDTQIKAGDNLVLTCSYLNDKDRVVEAGSGTTDEMCFNFMYVTPADASLDCVRPQP